MYDDECKYCQCDPYWAIDEIPSERDDCRKALYRSYAKEENPTLIGMALYWLFLAVLLVVLLPQMLAFAFICIVMCMRATRKHENFDDTKIKGQVKQLEDKQQEVQGEVKEIRGDIAMKALNVMLVHEKEPNLDKSSS